MTRGTDVIVCSPAAGGVVQKERYVRVALHPGRLPPWLLTAVPAVLGDDHKLPATSPKPTFTLGLDA